MRERVDGSMVTWAGRGGHNSDLDPSTLSNIVTRPDLSHPSSPKKGLCRFRVRKTKFSVVPSEHPKDAGVDQSGSKFLCTVIDLSLKLPKKK